MTWFCPRVRLRGEMSAIEGAAADVTAEAVDATVGAAGDAATEEASAAAPPLPPPPRKASAMQSHRNLLETGSSPELGSSSSVNWESASRDMAKHNFRFVPPEMALIFLSACSAIFSFASNWEREHRERTKEKRRS